MDVKIVELEDKNEEGMLEKKKKDVVFCIFFRGKTKLFY